MITYELFKMCKAYLAWYDDVVSFGQGCYLTDNDIKMAYHAEIIIKLYKAEEIEII